MPDNEPSVDPLFEAVRRMQKDIDAAPPLPSAFMASPLVPAGSAFRQWDARGRLLVWVNLGDIERLPRREYAGASIRASLAAPIGLGIPVIWA